MAAVVLCTSGVAYLMLILLHHLFLLGMIRVRERGLVLMICRRSETLLKVEVSVLAAYVLVVFHEFMPYRVGRTGRKFNSTGVSLGIPISGRLIRIEPMPRALDDRCALVESVIL